MKNILFATTALIATAGVAAADVSFSGYGRFGATYNDAAATQMATTSRFRLQVNASTEADNGLTFGARVRFQDSATTAMANSGAMFTVGAGGLTVSVGNINGAIESMAGMYPLGTKSAGLGLTGLGFDSTLANSRQSGAFVWDAYSSTANGRNGVAVSYSAGDFKVNASYSNTGAFENTALSASYAFSGWTVALGYQDSENNTTVGKDTARDIVAMTVGGSVGIAKIGFGVAQIDDFMTYQLTAGFEVGAATTITAYVKQEDNGTNSAVAGGSGYGLGVSHDLGGGASIEAGVAQRIAGNTVADLGLHFNF